MPKQLLDEARVNRQVFEVTSFAAAEETNRQYGRSRTPDGRLEALELSRQIAYGRLGDLLAPEVRTK
jgi:hypothetical protein